MKLSDINFKKVFCVFFTALLVFGIVSIAHSLATGGWDRAMNFEQNRMMLVQGQGDLTLQEIAVIRGNANFDRGTFARRGHGRFAAIGEMGEVGSAVNIITERREMSATFGDRFVFALARFWNSISAGNFDGFSIVGRLLFIAFNVLLAAWVYVDSQKHGRNKYLWGIITLVTSVFGFVFYLIMRENVILKKAA